MKTQTLKKLFLAVLIPLITQPAIAGQDKVIQVNTGEKRYDQLYLSIHYLEPLDKRDLVKGQTIRGNQWTFLIPDSLAGKASIYEFGYYNTKDEKNVYTSLAFEDLIEGDTLKVAFINFDRNQDTIRLDGTFLRSVSSDYYIYGDNNDSLYVRTYHQDLFMVDSNVNSFLKEAMQDPYFGYFQNLQKIERTYEEYLSYYAAKITANPQSVYYISRLDSWRSTYKSTDDIQKLYDLFAPEMQQSYFGKRISEYIRSKNRFLSSAFENMSLPVHGTEKLESIIQDSSKYNLVIFSASWCGPCREEIPLLKEVYNDLGNELSMTYISMDESKTVNSWGKLIKEQQIPWRSLLAEKDVKGIRKKYHEEGIPYTVLVYPGSQAIEVIDIRTKEDKNKLYSLFGK